jgi:hypothetical protein
MIVSVSLFNFSSTILCQEVGFGWVFRYDTEHSHIAPAKKYTANVVSEFTSICHSENNAYLYEYLQ